ncbi:hypothetical protein CDL12_29324 [Handroanthus impetiginosus]|uniref:Uncharacterized protein n=1 Tax=Handroanthus impetiginosus TaxID=429701 RepID=A0A2G9FZW9_9LAMI|nr:hypothetical protein CDL12_29324 [Handroanthus impetiginosus]
MWKIKKILFFLTPPLPGSLSLFLPNPRPPNLSIIILIFDFIFSSYFCLSSNLRHLFSPLFLLCPPFMPHSSSSSFGTRICNFFFHHLCFTTTSWTETNSRRRFYSCQKYKAYLNFDFNFIVILFFFLNLCFFFFGEMVVGLIENHHSKPSSQS